MENSLSQSASAIRPKTAESYRKAVERVILAMRERLDEPLSLEKLAEVAIISPYHFDRVFRQMTGIPPCQFLYALRIQEAKRLLLTTRLRVTDICFEVGYNSLGTFITRFTQLVGLTPRGLRRRAMNANIDLLESISNYAANDENSAGIKGEVSAPDNFSGIIFVGLFPTPIPQGRPVGCNVLAAQGDYHIPVARDGAYYVFAAGFPRPEDSLESMLAESAEIYVGISADRVTVKDGRAS